MDVMDDDGFDPGPRIPTGTCDRCGPAVKAYLFVRVKGTELAYCGSCGTRFFAKLVLVGTVIIDQRHAILP